MYSRTHESVAWARAVDGAGWQRKDKEGEEAREERDSSNSVLKVARREGRRMLVCIGR